MRFVDEARITIRSGKGGHGCVSFRREKFIPKGGPDGGDGGKGGDIVCHASTRMHTLYDFRHKRSLSAESGRPGEGSDKYGRDGKGLTMELPVGTLIYEQTEDGGERLLADLDLPDETMLLAKGGRGGKGNIHFKSPTNRAPRFAQPGEPGEEKILRLELKVIADAGLLGFPNAGKSTLISAVSAARPKIASYPFTTLAPNLGVIENDVGERLIVADIPGLVQGAHHGRGLGHTFLRHVDRTRFLVHLLSIEDTDQDNPWAGFHMLDEELAEFDPELAQKPQIRVVNKIDLIPPEEVQRLRERAKAEGLEIFFISALEGNGVDALLDAMWERLAALTEEDQDKTIE